MRTSLWPLLPLLLVGCADYALTMDNASPQAGDGAYDTGSSFADGGSGGADDGLPPETEDTLYLRPIATRSYVFIANEDRDTVTRVTVPGLEVLTAPTGSRPAVVAASPDGATAVVFAAGDDEVDVFDTTSLEHTAIPVRPDMNWMQMSPDGRWVVCYHDQDAPDPEADNGARSYNEVSLVDVTTGQHWPMVVGFNPRSVAYTPDSRMAIVVSDAYLGIIDLGAAEPTLQRVAIADDLVNPPLAEEVTVAPDGTWAFVRQQGGTDLVVVDLASGAVDRVPVGASLTDIDLSPDGIEAVAVARSTSKLWIFQMADPFATPRVLDLPTDAVLGSIVMSPDGARGLLYSTVSGLSRFASWERDTDEIVAHGLVKPVDRVEVSPDGATALVFHTKDDGSEVEASSPFHNRYALTMIDLSAFFSNPLLLSGEVLDLAQSEDGSLGYLVMDGQPWLEVLHYDSLLYDEVALKSAPEHVGVMPDGTTAWVSQSHPLGRISFYDPTDQSLQTLTGFELNAGIEH